MREAADAPGRVEAIAAAIAGPAFAGSCLFLREATLLPPGAFDAAAAILVAIGLAPLAHRRWGRVAATLLRGAGITLGVLLLTSALVPPFDRAVLPIAAWSAGAALLQAGARAKRGTLALAAAGSALLVAGWAGALALAPTFPEAGRLRVALLVAGPVALVLLGARLRLLRTRLRDLAPMPVGILLVVSLSTTYLAYRGLVATRVGNLPLYEWSLGVGVALLLLTRLRRIAREHEVAEPWTSDARRHAQDVAPVYDERMGPLAAVVQRYLDHGEGFEDYRAALLRAAPAAPARYRDALQAAKPPGLRGRAASRASVEARLAAHRDLLSKLNPEADHGHAPHGRT